MKNNTPTALLVLEDGTYPMAGVLPIVYGFSPKPQGQRVGAGGHD